MANKSLHPLKKKRDFEYLREQGRVLQVSHWLMLVSAPNKEAHSRVGWTIPKYVGIAVVRNRLRRWGRERIKGWNTKTWPENLDLNFVFKRKTADFYRNLNQSEFGTVFEKAFEKISYRSSKKIDP